MIYIVPPLRFSTYLGGGHDIYSPSIKIQHATWEGGMIYIVPPLRFSTYLGGGHDIYSPSIKIQHLLGRGT